MGWAYGKNPDGKEVGYSVETICEQEGCEVDIDRGLAYVCGDMHGEGADTCDGYFCGDHLFYGGPFQQCKACQEAHEKLPVEECVHGDKCSIHEDARLAAEEDED